MKRMSYWAGIKRDNEQPCKNARRITPEIIEMDCPECGGDGDWGKFLFTGEGSERYAEAFNIQLPYKKGSMPCIDCKGTGRVLA